MLVTSPLPQLTVLSSPPHDPTTCAVDPICGMSVDRTTGLSAVKDGQTYYFCSEHCRKKFVGEEMRRPPQTGRISRYICPMCPGIESPVPGNCPKCGMALEPEFAAADDEVDLVAARDLQRRLIVAAVFTVPLLLLAMGPMFGLPIHLWLSPQVNNWWQAVLALPVVGWAGWPLWMLGWQSVQRRRANMFTLISLGVLAATCFSVVGLLWPGLIPDAFRQHGHTPLFLEAAVSITTLTLIGQWLERLARRKTGSALRELLDLSPPMAHRLQNGQECDVPLADVVPGDLLRIRPGERIPVDGVVHEGRTAVDVSLLTGEPVPEEKGVGDAVIGGALNQLGSVVMRAERVGRETVLAQIVDLVSTAQRSRAPAQRLADAVSSWFVPAVLLISLATFVAWLLFGPEPRGQWALANAVSVLIIACPCALGLATPMAVIVGTGRGARAGILFRTAEALETLNRVSLFVLDKTGTVTEGKFRVVNVTISPDRAPDDVLRFAAAVEVPSEHPWGRAIVQLAREKGLDLPPVTEFTAVPGWGVQGRVEEHVIAVCSQGDGEPANETVSRAAVLIDGQPAGVLEITDPIRPTARTAVAQLHRDHRRVVMASGDQSHRAAAIARQLGLSESLGRQLPNDKFVLIRQEQQQGEVVAMVGDGINDAPALAAADVGIALGAGTDIAKVQAGVILMGNDLEALVKAVRLSAAVVRTIRQNLWFAFLYNGLGIPLAAGALYPVWGILLHPLWAAAAMSLSSVSVMANALRLRNLRLD